MTTEQIRTTKLQELEQLEAMTAAAPADHPARLALAAIRKGYDEGRWTQGWLRWVEPVSMRTLANDVAKGVDVYRSMIR